MNLHSLKPVAGSQQRSKRLGRGRASGKGKTSGRGHKGQMSRKGSGYSPHFEGGQLPFIRRLPKRGFNHASKIIYVPVNVRDLESFEEGTEVGLVQLVAAGLIRSEREKVKVLAFGELSKKLEVKAHRFIKSAQEQIEKAGGSCTLLS